MVLGFVHDFERFSVAFAKSAGVILASEIGDKTFFIAAVSETYFILVHTIDATSLAYADHGHEKSSIDRFYRSSSGPCSHDSIIGCHGMGST